MFRPDKLEGVEGVREGIRQSPVQAATIQACVAKRGDGGRWEAETCEYNTAERVKNTIYPGGKRYILHTGEVSSSPEHFPRSI